MTKPITGTTEECLKHFSKAADLNHVGRDTPKHVYQPRNKICDLLQIGYAAGYDWFGKSVMPSGVNLLKLQYFLELVGYTITEREPLSRAQHDLANHLALGVVSVQDAAQYTGVTDNTILRWSTGRAKPLDQKETSLKELIELHAKEAEEGQKRWQETLLELRYTSVQPTKPAQAVTVPRHETNGSMHGQLIDTLAHLILAAKPLAEQMLSDAYSPEEREQLRQKTQVVRSNGVFDLSNLLNRLCSERARKELNH